MIQKISTSLQRSKTAGHQGRHKVPEKVHQRFYWPGCEESVKQFIQCCEICQTKSGASETHCHSLVDWKISYPFHPIGLDFIGPLSFSNGNRFTFVIGDHFTKWYKKIPLPHQQAPTAANSLLEHWICHFGCPHSIHTDQVCSFESVLFQQLMNLPEINSTRFTSFDPQANSVIERMNRTLMIMLTESIDEEQTKWSYFFPYVLMAYRPSIHASTGLAPNRVILRHEVLLPPDVMYPLRPRSN